MSSNVGRPGGPFKEDGNYAGNRILGGQVKHG